MTVAYIKLGHKSREIFISGTGNITKEELSGFYSSVLGLDKIKLGEILDIAYTAMTSVSYLNIKAILLICL